MNYLTRALEPIVKKQAGKVTLLTGARQVGKSTLLLQVCRQLSLDGKRVLYISGEETASPFSRRKRTPPIFLNPSGSRQSSTKHNVRPRSFVKSNCSATQPKTRVSSIFPAPSSISS